MVPGGFAWLRAAAPYVRRFRERIFVVKLGGELLLDPPVRRHLCDQLALLHGLGMRLVLVHGGGPQLSALCGRLGLDVEKVAGRRVTDESVLEAAKMAFGGPLQVDLLADLTQHGVPAVGLSGVDAGLVQAHRRPPVAIRPDGEEKERVVDFGAVGDVDRVDPAVLRHLVDGGYVPVVASLSLGEHAQVYNTNADTVAAALARALKAEKLFFLLRVPGVLATPGEPSSLLSYLDLAEVDALLADGTLSGGMRPKAQATRDALQGGVCSVHLISGEAPDALLAEVFTNQGAGTMVVAHRDAG